MSSVAKGLALTSLFLLAYILGATIMADPQETPDIFANYLQSFLGKKIAVSGFPGVYLVKEVHLDYLVLEGGLTPLPEQRAVPFHAIRLLEDDKLYLR